MPTDNGNPNKSSNPKILRKAKKNRTKNFKFAKFSIPTRNNFPIDTLHEINFEFDFDYLIKSFNINPIENSSKNREGKEGKKLQIC